MFEKLGLTRMAQALAAHSGSRLQTIAGNVANADTPGFRALDVESFSNFFGSEAGSSLRTTHPKHFTNEYSQSPELFRAGSEMAPNGNDVSLDQQMMKAIEARQTHEMALAVYRSTSAIVRTSLGRSS